MCFSGVIFCQDWFSEDEMTHSFLLTKNTLAFHYFIPFFQSKSLQRHCSAECLLCECMCDGRWSEIRQLAPPFVQLLLGWDAVALSAFEPLTKATLSGGGAQLTAHWAIEQVNEPGPLLWPKTMGINLQSHRFYFPQIYCDASAQVIEYKLR